MAITGVSRNRRAIWELRSQLSDQKLNSQFPDQTGVYQVGFPFQIGPTEAGVILNIRSSGINTQDLEMGNDLLILDHPGAIDPKRIQELNRSDIKPHPRSGKPTLFARYPFGGGFVPFGALRTDGTPHPHAGSGFAVSNVVGFPGDQIVRNALGYKDAEQYQYQGVEIQQHSYNGSDFSIRNSVISDGRRLVRGYFLNHPGMSWAIPDGDDLLQPFYCDGPDKKWGCGVLRWCCVNKKWRPVEFTPVLPPGNASDKFLSAPFTEPSLVRDLDESLLFTARAQGTQPYAPGPLEAEHVQIWRSTDRGCSWTKILDVPHLRALTPMSLNRATDGTIYLAANPARTTNSFGQRLISISMRETLMIWPLSKNRRNLLDSIIVRDCPKEFSKPPYGSHWCVDHPNGITVRLSDKQWHHILAFRGMEFNECDSGAPVTPFTGTYLEEVYSNGKPVPSWKFSP